MTEEIGTVHILDQVQKHLLPLFPGAQTVVYRAEEHDSFRTGEPISAVEVTLSQEGFMIYTCPGLRMAHHHPSIQGLETYQRFALDQLKDDSDPSVGMYGYSPMEHGTYDTLGSALTEIARRFAAEVVGNSLHEEEEAKMIEEFNNEA